MADSDKTEKPTPKRLREARRKGQVAKSTELNAAAVLLAALVALWVGAGTAMEGLRGLLAEALRDAFYPDFWEALPGLLERSQVLLLVVYVCLFVASGAVVALVCRLQVGSVFSVDPVMPKLERVNPAAGLKRIFSKKTLVNFAMTLLKTLLVGAVVWHVARASLPDAIRMVHLSPPYVALVAGLTIITMLACTWLVNAAFSSVDVLLQRHWYIDDMKMAKHEVKRDHKESEGNPEVKMQRRALATELLFSQLEAKVAKANVVVVNPTHIAVAVSYRPGETELPQVVAKGTDDMAAVIRRIAESKGIPVVRDVMLARQLFESTPVDEYIGRDLFEPVARLLLWAREVESKHAAGEAGRDGARERPR